MALILPQAGWLSAASKTHVRASLWLSLLALLLFLPGFFTLPPMDRDEPRFAQASRQMLETGDFVAIRFQDEARNKKPVGIYWLQAAGVQAADWLGVPDARGKIWLYRLPSLLGALGAVLLTYWTALAFVSRENAFVAAMLLASTLLLGVEARLAKTDAVVTLTVIAAMGAMARLRLRQEHGFANALIFWTAIAVGILVKGPITPMIPLLAALVLSLQDRTARWLLALRPLAGLIWCLVLVAPWLILIAIKTHGAFFSDAIGGDMLGKVAGGQELHGAPPLTYFAVFWLTAWPMAPFAALAAPFIWRDRKNPAMLFLLAWLVPAWLLFELVPTKLPHYVLPLYPALAIAIALAHQSGALLLEARWCRLVAILLPLLGLLVAVAAIAASIWFKTGLVWPFAPTGILIVVLAALALFAILARATLSALLLAPALALSVAWLVYSSVLTTPAFQPFALSPRLAAARLSATRTCALAPATTGYREPSLVFLTQTSLVMTSGPGAAAFLDAAPCRIAFVDGAQEPAFTAALASGEKVKLTERITGINLNGGKALDIGVYVRQEDAP